MTLSRAQNIVMPKNINFVLFHCKGTFGPERYLRRRLEICRTFRTFKCALSLIRKWMWTFRCPPIRIRDSTAVCQYVDVNWSCESVETTAYDQNNDIQWYFHIFRAQKVQMSGLLLLCTELTFLCIELPGNCIYLNRSELSNFFMYIIRNSNN